MTQIGHVMILASAGSGKTYALTNRFIRLLAHGAPPERIAALTFTRKAAGEFFDEILKKLAHAATNPAEAKQLAEAIGRPALSCADFLTMLRGVVDAMHRLNLGTLDSFFARIVRAFPLELGLGGDFEMLEPQAARVERRRVLRRMFAHQEGDEARSDFIEAFKRATFGREEKRLGPTLDAFLDEHAEVFLAAPDSAPWGQSARIWPEGSDWLHAADPRKREAAAKALRDALPWPTFSDGQRKRWDDFFAELPSWSPGAPLPKPVEYLVGNTFKDWPAVTEITIERKKVSLSPDASRALHDLVKGIVGAELGRRLEMTQGIFAVLRGYETVYDEAVRRTGRLTFADVQRLLRPDSPDGARRLTREAAAEARLFIDWRLDAQIEHWLLDEFQDTSFGQWSVLRNLIDEAVQDPSAMRSFFYVGDVKQAIYAWREGDARLFREIFDSYNAVAPDTIREERLDKSWRSGPAVIEMVNHVFGDASAMRELFPEETAARWNREWRSHETVKQSLGGYAALQHGQEEADRFARTLAILQETQALERGLSVAVLVQTNQTAAELADYLRREGSIPATAESDLHVATDNPFTCALLALFRAAAHPGDAAAEELVAMSPLRTVLERQGLTNPDRRVEHLLREIHTGGFEKTVASWVRRVEPALREDDSFSRERGRQLAEAARLFDETGSRDVAEFLKFAESYTVRDADVAASVRVMTVHKSKGLGFDVVILPDLEGNKLASRRRGLAVRRAEDRTVDWILDLPSEMFFAKDDVLGAHVRAMEAEACYEQLALLYVAMTRAKRAMYIITKPVGKSASINFPRLLQETLGEDWSTGNARWYEAISHPGGLSPEPEQGVTVTTAARSRRLAQTPSRTKTTTIPGERLFSLTGDESAEFGREVHSLLAAVEWSGGGEEAVSRKKDRVSEAAYREALRCVRAAALTEVWQKPAGLSEVWRERSFEIVLDGAWFTGVFDRVVVQRDASGRVLRATVFDFKTDRAAGSDLAQASARHAPQLNLYRRVLATLLAIAQDAVSARIVFTEKAVSAEVPSS